MECQGKSLSFSFYYTRETDVIASILGGSRRLNFRGTHVYLLAQQPAMCGFRLSIEFGCGTRIDASKFLQPSADFSHFWYYIQNIDKWNTSLSRYHANNVFWPIAAHPNQTSVFCNIFQRWFSKQTFFSYISVLCNAIFKLTFLKIPLAFCLTKLSPDSCRKLVFMVVELKVFAIEVKDFNGSLWKEY